MKYSNDILKKLQEVSGEPLTSKIGKSADEITNAYKATVNKMKSLADIDDDEAGELASAAISSAVKTEGLQVNEIEDVRTIEDIEASEEDYEDFLKTKTDMETNEQQSPKVNKKMALLAIKDSLEGYMDMFAAQMNDVELRGVSDAIRSLVSAINLTESKIKITKGQLGTLIENVKKENK